MASSTSAAPTTSGIPAAIQNPFDFGYEGRVGISRELSDRRSHIDLAIFIYTSQSQLVPQSLQYEYLLSRGYYSAEELDDHPGRPRRSADEEVKKAATELTKMREYNEYVVRKGVERLRAELARLEFLCSEFEICLCPLCCERDLST